MRNLYIDFDGVILDTLPPVYKLAKQLNLDYKTQTKEMSKLFSKIDKLCSSEMLVISLIFVLNLISLVKGTIFFILSITPN